MRWALEQLLTDACLATMTRTVLLRLPQPARILDPWKSVGLPTRSLTSRMALLVAARLQVVWCSRPPRRSAPAR